MNHLSRSEAAEELRVDPSALGFFVATYLVFDDIDPVVLELWLPLDDKARVETLREIGYPDDTAALLDLTRIPDEEVKEVL